MTVWHVCELCGERYSEQCAARDHVTDAHMLAVVERIPPVPGEPREVTRLNIEHAARGLVGVMLEGGP